MPKTATDRPRPPSVEAVLARLRSAADGTDPEALTAVRGQVEVATTEGVIDSIALVPPDPPAAPEALKAIEAADWVVLGPGSWFTSVLPHLMVPAPVGHHLRDRIMEVCRDLGPEIGPPRPFLPSTGGDR